MRRSDICVICVVYATCAFFLYQTLQLKASAQIYPLCLIGGLAILNTLYLIRRLVLVFRENAGSGSVINDFPEIFKNFQAGQFFFVLGACTAYLVVLPWLGFYLTGLIYLVGVMLWLRVKPLRMTATVVILGALVYGVFTLFLKVPLPKGALFG